jgi:hypothetical protein
MNRRVFVVAGPIGEKPHPVIDLTATIADSAGRVAELGTTTVDAVRRVVDLGSAIAMGERYLSTSVLALVAGIV